MTLMGEKNPEHANRAGEGLREPVKGVVVRKIWVGGKSPCNLAWQNKGRHFSRLSGKKGEEGKTHPYFVGERHALRVGGK